MKDSYEERRKKAQAKYRERLREAQKKSPATVLDPFPQPRYDEVFFEGMRVLDEQDQELGQGGQEPKFVADTFNEFDAFWAAEKAKLEEENRSVIVSNPPEAGSTFDDSLQKIDTAKQGAWVPLEWLEPLEELQEAYRRFYKRASKDPEWAGQAQEMDLETLLRELGMTDD